MKSSRFNYGNALWRTLLALCAVFFVSFSFISCQQEEDTEYVTTKEFIYVIPLEENNPIIADWESSYGEKYSISRTEYKNYSHYNDSFEYDEDNWYLYYSTDNLFIYKESETSGFIYGQFNDADHVGYGASKDQWYALRYTDLTSSSVQLWQPYKVNGKAATDTLEEAVKEFTVENGYYAASSECVK